jgi:carboxysome shell carbonic anhydrase
MTAQGIRAVPRPGALRAYALPRNTAYGTQLLPAIERRLETPSPSTGRHVLADEAVSAALRARAGEIEAAFDAIEPALRRVAPLQFERDFVKRANDELSSALGFDVAPSDLYATWAKPLDVRSLYGHCILATFCRLVDRAFDRSLSQLSDGEDAQTLIRRWGFHAVDITPCADGRMSGVIDYILRVPPAVVTARKSYAGAMFDIEETVRFWETVELGRWSERRPNAATEPTRYLKIGVYHFSNADPKHQGCAAHGHDQVVAATALLQRLEQVEQAMQEVHGRRASVATLLIGVDTDSDAIRVHVPDRAGRMAVRRYIDNNDLYERTLSLSRDAAKEAIRAEVAVCAGVPQDDGSTEGIRWLCGYLLKNNIAQVDAVKAWHGGAYSDRGHTERLIVIGDALDDVQLRNLVFQAQMETVEEGAADLDIGIRILGELYEPRELAIPVLVHVGYDPRVPGSRERAEHRASRLQRSVVARYAQLEARGMLHVHAVVRGGTGAPLTLAEPPALAREYVS